MSKVITTPARRCGDGFSRPSWRRSGWQDLHEPEHWPRSPLDAASGALGLPGLRLALLLGALVTTISVTMGHLAMVATLLAMLLVVFSVARLRRS